MADFDAVVCQYWPLIFRFAMASLKDSDAAQTVAQDCFVKAYRGRERFRGDARLQTWLMRIAINLVRDYTRSRKRRFWRQAFTRFEGQELAQHRVRDGRIDPLQRLIVKERTDALWSVVGQLPERERKVFLLRYVEKLTFPRISKATGLREGATKVHAYRALQLVRDHLGRLNRHFRLANAVRHIGKESLAEAPAVAQQRRMDRAN